VFADVEGIGGAGYAGGEENRWGDVGLRMGESTGAGDAGCSDDEYVSGPVLNGFKEIGACTGSLFGASMSPFDAEDVSG
jgi:hypothetical protein